MSLRRANVVSKFYNLNLVKGEGFEPPSLARNLDLRGSAPFGILLFPLSTRNGGVLPIELTLVISPIHLSCCHSGTHGVFRGAKPVCTLSLPIRPIVRVNDAVLKRYSPYILLRGYSEPLL